ncbi:peptidoglycan recognition protein 6 [Anguilla rostrata]|uniref:peptidoglycan recognition protein 6 n=1 Tax=Anguilla rostrata TaxID=7938 RepID=UPI0030D1F025
MGPTATRIVAMVMLGITARCHDPPQRSMESFIAAVEQVEAWNPELKGVALLRSLRGWGGLDGPLVRHFLGPPSEEAPPTLPSAASDFFRSVIGHRVTEAGEEEGVVLTQDGTTVALAPLILGLEAGLRAGEGSPLSGVYALALAQTLGLSFLRSPPPDSLGPDGCWDNVTSPRAFTLSGTPSLATDALVNGGMDGVVLGTELFGRAPERPPVLSGLLRRYYQHRLRDGGLGSAPRLISPRRRQNFRELVSPALLREQVREALALRRRLAADPALAQGAETEAAALDAGLELFVRRYTECPAIIPRCQWEAEPYRGTPTLLALPLSFLYVHHTYEPSRPCLTFQQCAADMRSMQRFHQDDRGWDDIGYSFVAGSDGYIYEGRGWNWRGAHTKGQNSRGYGVSIIGDYTIDLPSRPTLELVRDRLTACAVGGDRLIANYTIHGHRQLVNTSCPGDALFSEIQGWAHFREVQL